VFLEDKIGKPFLRSEDVRDNYLDFSTIHYVADDVHQILHKSHCKKNQVILTMAGAYLGRSAVFDKEFECSSNQATAKITLKDNKVLPYFLSTFLNCYYGQFQINRYRTLTGQPNINLGQIQTLRVPILSNAFQLEIERLVKSAHSKLEKSKALYAEAEKMLLGELGLSNWRPSTENVAVKSLKESFLETGRLDAEYFQPKYDELMRHIFKYSMRLDDLVDIQKSVEPGSDYYTNEGTPFIRVANIFKTGLTETEIHLSKTFVKPFEYLKPKSETVLLTKDGSVGISYCLTKDLDILVSSAILMLTVKDKTQILPQYLSLVLNSMIVKMQADRDVGGSIIQHWRIDDIRKLQIPIIEFTKQEAIQRKILESFELQTNSKQLLELAKQAVEVTIEQDENAALAMINGK
jgi:restriction endonuclease S subunit